MTPSTPTADTSVGGVGRVPAGTAPAETLVEQTAAATTDTTIRMRFMFPPQHTTTVPRHLRRWHRLFRNGRPHRAGERVSTVARTRRRSNLNAPRTSPSPKDRPRFRSRSLLHVVGSPGFREDHLLSGGLRDARQPAAGCDVVPWTKCVAARCRGCGRTWPAPRGQRGQGAVACGRCAVGHQRPRQQRRRLPARSPDTCTGSDLSFRGRPERMAFELGKHGSEG